MASIATTSWAQIPIVSPPANPDYSASTLSVFATTIENTGNDMKPQDASFWHVNTWDGDAPAWSYAVDNAVIQTSPIQGTILGKVTDPYIVLSADLQWVRIVYVLDGTMINTELWQYNGSGYSYISTQTLTTEGINPNIDVNNRSLVAVTYQDISSPFVYSYVEEINNTLFGPVFITAEGLRPDVAISNEKGGLGSVVVSFTYIQPGNNVLVLDQHRYTNILGGSSISISFTVHPPDEWSTNNGVFGYPRIAHNWYDMVHTCSYTLNEILSTCAIAVDFTSSSGNYIYTLTKTVSCPTPGTAYEHDISNLLASAFNDQNSKPVISYSGDVIVVAWQYSGFTIPFTAANDIIVWRLNWDGTHWGINNYSIVNQSVGGDQVIPSVSGRYNIGASSADCYYLFVDIIADRNYFKGSFYHNVNLKSEQTGGTPYSKQAIADQQFDIEIYPNPVTDILNIKRVSSNSTFEIFDALGKKILESQSTTDELQIPLPSTMLSGSYILRIKNDTFGVKHFPFIKQ